MFNSMILSQCYYLVSARRWLSRTVNCDVNKRIKATWCHYIKNYIWILFDLNRLRVVSINFQIELCAQNQNYHASFLLLSMTLHFFLFTNDVAFFVSAMTIFARLQNIEAETESQFCHGCIQVHSFFLLHIIPLTWNSMKA